MTNNHGSCLLPVGQFQLRLQLQLQLQLRLQHRLQLRLQRLQLSSADTAIYFCIKLQFGQRWRWRRGWEGDRGEGFPTIYTDIMMINNAQTCHMLVSCVFDWSALGARLVMISKSAKT